MRFSVTTTVPLVGARAAGIGWPLPAEWTDEVLEQRLFARSGVKPGRRRHSEPDWTTLARELKRAGVNLMVLWEEYRQVNPDGNGYSRYVAPGFMLRHEQRAKDTALFPARAAHKRTVAAALESLQESHQ